MSHTSGPFSNPLRLRSWIPPLLGRLASHGVVRSHLRPALRYGALWREPGSMEELLRGVTDGAAALPSDRQIDEPDGERKEQEDDQRPGAP